MVHTPATIRGHHHFIDKLAVINGAVSGFALYPQIFLILYSGVPNTMSTVSLMLIVINNLVWTAYGVHRSLSSVVLASVLSGLAAAILLYI